MAFGKRDHLDLPPQEFPVLPPISNKRPSPVRRVFRALYRLVVLGLVIAGGLAAYGYYQFAQPGPLAEVKTVEIERGLSTPEIAAKLEASGVISSTPLFTAVAIVTGARGKLKAGEYEFPVRASMSHVMDMLVGGRVLVHKVSIPEGWTSEMALARIMEHPVLAGEVGGAPEGAILPDTYVVKRGMKRQELLDLMIAGQAKLLEEVWAKRKPDLEIKTKEEAVILASIVEKETGIASERPLIASVFMNRLRKGMRLQSDPTIIYGMVGGKGKLDRELSRADVAAPTPYNTYTINGLPPGPIANPGRASLEAVVNPPDTDYLYFVADGTGGHVFAKTLDEHNRNVAKWRKIENGAAP